MPQGIPRRCALEFAANGLLLNIASGEVDDPSQIPPLGLSATVRSMGDSPRALASVANGRLILTQGPGRIDNSAVDAWRSPEQDAEQIERFRGEVNGLAVQTDDSPAAPHRTRMSQNVA